MYSIVFEAPQRGGCPENRFEVFLECSKNVRHGCSSNVRHGCSSWVFVMGVLRMFVIGVRHGCSSWVFVMGVRHGWDIDVRMT